jgi:anti-sigma factor RsiW
VRCTSVRKNLSAYLDAQLSSAISAEMGTHLQCCAACRLAWLRLRQIGDLLRNVAAPPVPDGFVHRVLSQARRRVVCPPPAARASFDLVGYWRSVPLVQRAAAAAVLIVGLSTGLAMGWQTTGTQTANSSTAVRVTDDPLAVFNLDYLGGDPNGSLPRAYLTLVASDNRPGE